MSEELDRRIAPLRRQIDLLDDQLVDLLNERARLALDIGDEKTKVGVPIYAPHREAAILARVTARSPGPLSGAALRRLFERIIDESRSLERAAQGGESGPPEGGEKGRS